MAKFFLKSFIFSSIFFLIVFVIEFNLAGILNSYVLKGNCLKDPAVELAILGSSQAYYGFNPALFSSHGCNLANSNQDFYYDNQLTNKYLSQTSNLKTVFLSVSYFSFEFKLVNTEESWRRFFYSRFLGLKDPIYSPLDLRNYSLIALYTPKNSLSYISQGFKVNLAADDKPNGWINAHQSNSSSDTKANALRHTSYMHPEFSGQNGKLLEQTIQLLKQKGVRVILITPPTTKKYYQNIDQQKYTTMQQNISYFTDKYSLTYLNYFQDNRFQDEDFVDRSDHLNSAGAAKLAKIIKEDLTKP